MSGYIGQAPVVQATQTRQSFTATYGQTSFSTLGYQENHLDVFLNGVKLNAADYTATNNSDIVLAAGCAVNDILEMVAFGTFEVANQSFTGTTVINTLTVTNDGTGSNLDADLLDGQHGAYYTGYTDTQLAALVDSSPAALNTLNELAAALGDDANFSTTVTNSIATKLPLAGGAMTGAITTNSTFDGVDIASRDAVLTATTTTANAALPKAGGALTGNLSTTASIIIAGTEETPLKIEHTDGPNVYFQLLNNNDGNGNYLGAENQELNFWTNNTKRMAITSAGNVGIGTLTSNIGATLHVDPATNVTTAFGAPLIKVGGSNSWAGNGSTYSIGFGYNSASAHKAPAEIGLVTTNASGATFGDLVFATRSDYSSSTAPTERMRITSAGSLGVNTISPLSTLQVRDVGSENGSLRVGGSGAGLGLELTYNQSGATTSIIQANPTYTNVGTLLKIRADGDANPDQLVLSGAGNVGIGTSPESTIKVDVNSGTNVNPMRLRFTNDNNGASTNPLHFEHKAGLEIENGYSGASPSANGTKVAKIQLTTVTSSGYGASGTMMAVAESGGFDAGALVFATGANSSGLETERMRINNAGIVTMPYQPAFHAQSPSGGSTSNGGTDNARNLLFAGVPYNNGGHYATSNGRFTAPVTGIYYFAYSVLWDDSYNGTGIFSVRKNDSSNHGISYINDTGQFGYLSVAGSAVVQLNANEWVNCYAAVAGIHVGSESGWTGFLIG